MNDRVNIEYRVQGQDLYGRLRVDKRVYMMEPVGEGLHVFYELDPTASRVRDGFGKRIDANEAEKDRPPQSNLMANMSGGGSTNIDVLVVYTQAVANAHNETTLIDNAISQTNTTLAQSNVDATVSLAHSAQVNYSESGDVVLDTDRLQDPGDNKMDNVHNLRYHSVRVNAAELSNGVYFYRLSTAKFSDTGRMVVMR